MTKIRISEFSKKNYFCPILTNSTTRASCLYGRHLFKSDKGISTSQELTRNQTSHTEDVHCTCNVCDKNSFTLKTCKIYHTEEIKFCRILCDKFFTQSGKLNKHKLSHLGEKSFMCTQCEKASSLTRSLKRHKVFHTGEKKFTCTQCNKTFSMSCHLKTHKPSHTGDKKYVCTQCDKANSESGNLNRHKLFHTGKKFTCKQCNQGIQCNLKIQKTFPPWREEV